MKIAFFYNTKTTWTLKDLDILRTSHDVDAIYVRSLKDCFRFIFKSNPLKYDSYFFWFASFSFYPAFVLAKLLRRKVFTVAGGFDVASVPSIGFGAYARGKVSCCLRTLFFKASDKVLSVSKSNHNETLKHTGLDNSKVEMIYHGFKSPSQKLKPWGERKNVIITIGQVTLENTMVKGHAAFCEVAKRLPEFEFILIGRSEQSALDFLKVSEIPNLKVTGFLPDDEFNELLNTSKIYLQLSHHEGFGCSVVDAALMGSFPIVYDVYALPEVVSGMGATINFGDINSVAASIRENLEADHDPEKIRSFYLQKFSYSQREQAILHSVKF